MWSLTCLFVSRLLLVCVLVHRSSATRQSARPSLVRRCPVSSGHGRCSVCSSLTCRCSAAALPLVRRWSGSLICLNVHHWSACSSAATPLGCSAALPLYSAARLLHSAARLLDCSTRLLDCSTRLLDCSTRLLDCSTRLLYRSTRLLDSTPLDSPCAHSYSICWLSLAATLFTHTLSHAWCPVTLLSLIRCSTVVVTAAASCRRARDSVARCVVAARLPPSAASVTVPTDCSFLAVQRLNAVHCTALHSIAQQHTRAFKRWFLCRSLVLLESFERRRGS